MGSATITGLDDLVKNLRALPAELAGKNGGPIRQGLSACAKVVRDECRSLAPVNEDGFGAHLRDEIIMKRDPNPRAVDNAVERYIVTVKYKAKKYANNRANRRMGRVAAAGERLSLISQKVYQSFGDFFYWRFVEFGTSKMPARSFMRRGFENVKTSLPDIFIKNCAAGIAAIVKKMSKS